MIHLLNNHTSPLDTFHIHLRDIRKQQGLSLRDLAAKAGVTPALISMIERGKIRPSIHTLYAIADVLKISVADIMKEELKQSRTYTVLKCEDRLYVNAREGKSVFQECGLVGPDFEATEMEPAYVRLNKKNFQPQSASLRGDQLILCLNGRFDYACDNITYTLAPGDSLFFDSHIPHGPVRVHTPEADYVVVYVNELYGWLDMRLDFRNSFTHPPHASDDLSPTQRIAWRIRYARAKRGLQQTYVRALTGFSHGMLSHIESGRAAPSLTTLHAISRALDVPLCFFFDDSSPIQKTIFIPTEERRYSIRKENGHTYSMCPLVTRAFGMPLFTPEYRVYERASFTPQKAKKKGQFFVMVIKGSVSFHYNGTEEILDEGDTIYGHASSPHGIAQLLSLRAEVLYVQSHLSKYLSHSLRQKHNL